MNGFQVAYIVITAIFGCWTIYNVLMSKTDEQMASTMISLILFIAGFLTLYFSGFFKVTP